MNCNHKHKWTEFEDIGDGREFSSLICGGHVTTATVCRKPDGSVSYTTKTADTYHPAESVPAARAAIEEAIRIAPEGLV